MVFKLKKINEQIKKITKDKGVDFMVTLLKVGDECWAKSLEICGLSTDTKPINTINGIDIVNGSIFTEMDTKAVFMYSQSDAHWYEM